MVFGGCFEEGWQGLTDLVDSNSWQFEISSLNAKVYLMELKNLPLQVIYTLLYLGPVQTTVGYYTKIYV